MKVVKPDKLFAKLYSTNRITQFIQRWGPEADSHHIRNNQNNCSCNTRFSWKSNLFEQRCIHFNNEFQLYRRDEISIAFKVFENIQPLLPELYLEREIS